MNMLHAFALALSVALVRAAGLTDDTIAADLIASLDSAAGTTWTATQGDAGAFAGCDFAPLGGRRGGGSAAATALRPAASADPKHCCELCWREALCTVALHSKAERACTLLTADEEARASRGGQSHAATSTALTRCTPMRRPRGAMRALSIPARVPGDLLTDLQRAGQIGDPLHERNWLNSSLWNRHTWTYTATFPLPEAARGLHASGGRTTLVFDGIKMGATISLNGKRLGVATDQFLRYTFPLPAGLGAQPNYTLQVSFDPTIDVGGRFAACTGGWDWAPYSHTLLDGAHTFSKGIWKSVYLATSAAASAAIAHVVPQISYRGDYPTRPLVDGEHGGFEVRVRVFLSARAPTSGVLTLNNSWGGAADVAAVSVPAGASNVTLATTASAKQVRLWWPAGAGEQPLYDIGVSFAPAGAATPAVAVCTSRRVGFRYVALVTGNDTDPAFVAAASGSQGSAAHGMYFRVNGAVVWARGANMIPMEELEGRLDARAHARLVRSAAEGGFNMLRVWGGGMFLPDAFYDACDADGLLVYHDMQYAQSGHAPRPTRTQEEELRHNVRRLASHASIVVWDGCNECRVVMKTPTAVYATFVMTVVAQEDGSRAVWPSCPALGWTAGVRMLDALPNGNPLTTPPKGVAIETHGPYQHGTGFPAVNGAAALQLFDANIPITPASELVGPAHANVFASEFGAAVMSSFESMAPTLAPRHWGLHAGQPSDECTSGFAHTCNGSNVMAERNYPCDNMIDVYFGKRGDAWFNSTGEAVFKRQLYMCMLSQALHMKSNIETRRSRNQLGVLVWQYNEIWPTGGWGSIEYGTPVPGQVIGGRWKPLQYFYRRALFADVIAACGEGGACYVRNDAAGVGFDGRVIVSALEFASGNVSTLATLSFAGGAALPAGAGAIRHFSVDLGGIDGSTHMLVAHVIAELRPEDPAELRPEDPAELRPEDPAELRPEDPAVRVAPRRSTAVGAARVAPSLAPSEIVISVNEIALSPPAGMALPAATVVAAVADAANPDGTVDVTLVANATALYVSLTTLAHGRFSDNSFAMEPGTAKVQFVPFATGADGELGGMRAIVKRLQMTLRVEHLQEIMQGARRDELDRSRGTSAPIAAA